LANKQNGVEILDVKYLIRVKVLLLQRNGSIFLEGPKKLMTYVKIAEKF